MTTVAELAREYVKQHVHIRYLPGFGIEISDPHNGHCVVLDWLSGPALADAVLAWRRERGFRD